MADLPAMRPIDGRLIGPVKRPADLGAPPRLAWIDIADLRVDPRYQREISPHGRRNARAIAEGFDWTKFGPVVVAPLPEPEGDGRRLYAVIDGQHRSTAAAALRLGRVPCFVVDAGPGEQANAFRAINAATTRVHPVQLFKAALAAGDREAHLVAELCRAADVRLLGYVVAGRGMKARETISVDALTRLARERRGLALAALRGIAAQARGGRNLLRSIVLDAVRLVLAERPDWQRDEARFLAALSQVDLHEEWPLAMAAKARGKGVSALDSLVGRLTTALLPLMKRGAP